MNIAKRIAAGLMLAAGSFTASAQLPAEMAEWTANLPERAGTGENYGFDDWRLTDAQWQVVRDYYSSPERGDERMVPEHVDLWRPYFNPGDRHPRHPADADRTNPAEFMGRYYRPGAPEGLGNAELADLGYVDVTAEPFNVIPDDGQDDTDRLQDAIDFARDHQLVTYLPAGDYHVRHTLMLAQAHIRHAGGEVRDRELYGCQLVGQTVGADRRARLILADGTYTDPDDAHPVVYVFKPSNIRVDRHPVRHAASTKNYAQLVAGVDIVLGDNPGAWGVSFQAPEGSSLQDVTIHAEGGIGGVTGVLGSGGGMFDVTVIGGRVGIATAHEDSPVYGNDAQPGPTITGATLINQSEWALDTNVRGPLTVVGADIRTDRPGPVIRLRERWWREPFANSLALIESTVQYPAPDPINTVIDTQRSFYLENCFVENASYIFDQRLDVDDTGWTHVRQAALAIHSWNGATRTARIDMDRDGQREEVTVSIDEGVWIDGQRVGDHHLDAAPTAAPPEGLTTRHHLGDWPTFNTPGIVSIRDHGAVGDGDTDDTDAVQAAIAAAGRGGVVFVPKGVYVIRDTLQLLPDQTLIGVHHKISQLMAVDTASRGRFGGNEDPANVGLPLVRTHDAADDRTRIGFLGLRVNRTYDQHDPEPIGVYGLEWRSGLGQVRGVEVKYDVHTNWWEFFILFDHYGLDREFVHANHQRSEDGRLDPRVGWEIPDPEGFGDYGNGPGPNGEYDLSPLNHSLVQVRGNGGGQWFQFWNHGYDPVSGDHRTLLVEDTVNRFEVYHLHIQHKRSDAQAEFRNARHVDVYGIKQEMHGVFLEINDSSHVRVHGMAGIGGPYADGEPMFRIRGQSSDILITNLGDEPQFTQDSFGALSPRNRLWRAFVMRFPAIVDEATDTTTPPGARPILYQIGDPVPDLVTERR
jgi:hypothetical protein